MNSELFVSKHFGAVLCVSQSLLLQAHARVTRRAEEGTDLRRLHSNNLVPVEHHVRAIAVRLNAEGASARGDVLVDERVRGGWGTGHAMKEVRM